MRHGPLAVLIAGLTLALTGCGSGDAAAGEPAPVLTTAGEPPPALTAAEEETLRQASERLIARCMTAHGFAYTEQPPPVPERRFRYLLDNVDWAREHGYGTLTGRRDLSAHDVNDGTLAALTPARRPAWHRALMGAGKQLTVDLPDTGRLSAPDNGCLAEAHRTLYGDLEGWYRARRTVDHLPAYLTARVTGSPDYRTALTGWAGCVRERGYAVDTPAALRALVTTEPPGPLGAPEITAAVTEAECAVTTGLPGTIGALEQRFRPEIEGRFTNQIETLHRYERTALSTAGTILAGS